MEYILLYKGMGGGNYGVLNRNGFYIIMYFNVWLIGSGDISRFGII